MGLFAHINAVCAVEETQRYLEKSVKMYCRDEQSSLLCLPLREFVNLTV